MTETELLRGYRLDSLALNATLAALDERSQRLATERVALLEQPPTRSRDFALECNADAIRDTERARLAFARQVPVGEIVELAPVDAHCLRYRDHDQGIPHGCSGLPPVEDAIDAYKAGRERGLGYHDVQARP